MKEMILSCLKLEKLKHTLSSLLRNYLQSPHRYVQSIKFFQFTILPIDQKLTENYIEFRETDCSLYIHHIIIINNFQMFSIQGFFAVC